MKNPIREIADIKKREFSVVALLFLFFLLVIAVFQSLYGPRRGLFVETYGADIELYARLTNIVVAALGVVVFTFLYDRFSRQTMVQLICLFFVSCFILFAVVLREPSGWSIWSFYLVGDLVTTLLVAGFWAYATDLCSPGQAKRLFGVVGGGGIIGGVVGSGMTYLLLEPIGMRGLILIGAVLMAAIIFVATLLERSVNRTGAFQPPRDRSSSAGKERPQESKLDAALEGARLVLQSPYLAAIVGIMTFYEMASQVMEYQLSFILEGLSGVLATQAGFSDIRFYTNLVSVLVQFLMVSFIMRRFGLVAALLILPVGIVGFSSAFIAVPTLFMAGCMNIYHNGVNYSLQQTARETLYVVTTRDEKFKARAFTNMFVQRLAKGLSIFLVMGLRWIRVEVYYLSVICIVVAAAMILCSVFAGRTFQRKTEGMELSSTEA